MPGISAVLRIPVEEKNTVEDITRKLELLGAAELCKVNLMSSIYRPVQGDHNIHLQVVTHSDFPATCFILNGTDFNKLTSFDLAFREFPGLLKGTYEFEKKLQVDGRGAKYRLGDFHINIIELRVGQSPTTKAFLLEVSFRLMCPLIHCEEILRSFIRQHFPELMASQGESIFTEHLKRVLKPSTEDFARVSIEKMIAGEAVVKVGRSAARTTIIQYFEHLRDIRRW